MKLITLLLIVFFILYLLRPLIRIAFSMHRAQKQYRKMWEEMANAQQSRQNRSTQHGAQRHKKVYSKADGEYVEFEEIAEERHATVFDDGSYTEEDNITDVKYEEIKD